MHCDTLRRCSEGGACTAITCRGQAADHRHARTLWVQRMEVFSAVHGTTASHQQLRAAVQMGPGEGEAVRHYTPCSQSEPL